MDDTCHDPGTASLLEPPTPLPPLLDGEPETIQRLEMMASTGDRTAVDLLLPLLILWAVTGSAWSKLTPDGEDKEKGMFVLGKAKTVMKTEGGEVKMACGHGWRGEASPMHIGFVSMEPNTLFIPQYVDANLIIFVRGVGHAKIGWISKDKMLERRLRSGDVTVIPAGSAFYLINNCRDRRLEIIASIDPAEGIGYGSFQSFFIGGGSYPTSILSGFDSATIAAAFNVTSEELSIMLRQSGGPIVRMDPSEANTDGDEDGDGSEEKTGSTWRIFVEYILYGKKHHRHHHKRGENHGPVHAHHAYNLYDREPDFSNDYGSTVAVDAKEFAPLKHTGVGVYFVSLTAGSMMAPHVNPTAIEYGVVLKGAGTIQVVFPNGTLAMNAEVSEGDVFWVPRYFPFCQVAARGQPLEFFGFSTSSRKNRPQFLAGRKSVLRTMRGAALARAFNVSEDQLDLMLRRQREEVILPAAAAPAAEGLVISMMMSRRFMLA